MRSAPRGTRTSAVEVTNVSSHGFWLLLEEHELFLSFQKFPWFREAPIAKLVRVQRPSPHHLYWPDLDVDLAVDSIKHPERFPLVSKVRSPAPPRRRRPTTPRPDDLTRARRAPSRDVRASPGPSVGRSSGDAR